jgi:hypothetical protein
MKKWIKLSLTKKEKELLRNKALSKTASMSSFIKYLIHKFINEIKFDKDLDKAELHTAFEITEKEENILNTKANELNITKNKVLRILISNLKVKETDIKKELLDKQIITRIDLETKLKLKKIAEENFTTAGAIIRESFQDFNSLKIIENQESCNKKISINVSQNFKNQFTIKAKELKVSEAELLRNIIYSITA